MRLDRVLIKGNVKALKINITFNQPLEGQNEHQQDGWKVEKYWKIKGGLLFIADTLFKWNLRDPNKKYLFPSDHFGL